MITLINSDGQSVVIASANIDSDFTGTLQITKGSPSDGFGADILDVKGNVVGKASNYMDGQGWFCRFLSAQPVTAQT